MGEAYVFRLIAKENRTPPLSSKEIETINDFLTDADNKADTQFHDVAATNGYSRFASKLTTGTGSRTIDLKRFPTDWAASDTIRIVDYGKNPKDVTVTLTAVDSGQKEITFADPGHGSTFKRKTTFAYKIV